MAVVIAQVNDGYTYGRINTTTTIWGALKARPCVVRSYALPERRSCAKTLRIAALVARSRSHITVPQKTRKRAHISTVMYITPLPELFYPRAVGPTCTTDEQRYTYRGRMTPEEALNRFDRKIRWAAGITVRTFHPYVEYDEAEQEAKILVLTYAGFIPGQRHSDLLARAEAAADNDEERVQAILAADLRRDLLFLIGRQLDTDDRIRFNSVSLDALPPKYQGSYTMDDEVADRVDRQREVTDQYPYLALRYFRRMSLDEISESQGVSLATVKRRIAEEKKKAYGDPAIRTRAGLGLAA